MAVNAGQTDENLIVDAVGPEVFTFKELVQLLAKAVGSQARIIHVNPRLALGLSRLVGYALRDVVLTRDEIAGLLVSERPPTGQTRLSEWLAANAGTIGQTYASELARHYR